MSSSSAPLPQYAPPSVIQNVTRTIAVDMGEKGGLVVDAMINSVRSLSKGTQHEELAMRAAKSLAQKEETIDASAAGLIRIEAAVNDMDAHLRAFQSRLNEVETVAQRTRAATERILSTFGDLATKAPPAFLPGSSLASALGSR